MPHMLQLVPILFTYKTVHPDKLFACGAALEQTQSYHQEQGNEPPKRPIQVHCSLDT